MITDLFSNYKDEIICSIITIVVLFVIKLIVNFFLVRAGKRINKSEARTKLIGRYVSVALFIIGILIAMFIFDTNPKDIAVVFSSVFAVIGIGLFAIWSILSNVTSGIIMFFSFPYKIGDKIEIHDKDFPIKAIIEDIKAFHIHLRLDNGNLVTYPNNLILQKAVTLIEKNTSKRKKS